MRLSMDVWEGSETHVLHVRQVGFEPSGVPTWSESAPLDFNPDITPGILVGEAVQEATVGNSLQLTIFPEDGPGIYTFWIDVAAGDSHMVTASRQALNGGMTLVIDDGSQLAADFPREVIAGETVTIPFDVNPVQGQFLFTELIELTSGQTVAKSFHALAANPVLGSFPIPADLPPGSYSWESRLGLSVVTGGQFPSRFLATEAVTYGRVSVVPGPYVHGGSLPSEVYPGESIEVRLHHDSEAPLDLWVSCRDADDGALIGSASRMVIGPGSTDLTVAIDASAIPGSRYTWDIRLVPLGSGPNEQALAQDARPVLVEAPADGALTFEGAIIHDLAYLLNQTGNAADPSTALERADDWGLMTVDLSAFPEDAVVDSAIVRLPIADGVSGDVDVVVHRGLFQTTPPLDSLYPAFEPSQTVGFYLGAAQTGDVLELDLTALLTGTDGARGVHSFWIRLARGNGPLRIATIESTTPPSVEVRYELQSGGTDAIVSANFPSAVEQGSEQVVTVTVDAGSTGATPQRFLWVGLQDSEGGWANSIAPATLSLQPGSQTVDIPVAILPNARVGSGHVWVARLFAGEPWLDAPTDDALDAAYGEADVLPGSGLTDALSIVTFPENVPAGTEAVVVLDYSASEPRELWIGMQDSLNAWATAGVTTVEVHGAGSLSVPVPIQSEARSGPGYLWVIRLLPLDASSHEEALAAYYAEVTVGDPNSIPDDLLEISVPEVLTAGESAPVTVQVSAAAGRELGIYLQDSMNGWSTAASTVVSLDEGESTLRFDLALDPGTRLGDGHLWVVRLLPEGWESHEQALDAFYADAAVAPATSAVTTTPATREPLFRMVTLPTGLHLTWPVGSHAQFEVSHDLRNWSRLATDGAIDKDGAMRLKLPTDQAASYFRSLNDPRNSLTE